MDDKREAEVFKLIDERSTAHVRDLRDAYRHLKKQKLELEAELQELKYATASDYANGYNAGMREMRDAFTDFLLKASAASTLKVAELERLDPAEVVRKIRP